MKTLPLILLITLASCEKYVAPVVNTKDFVKQVVEVRTTGTTITRFTYDYAGRVHTIVVNKDTSLYTYNEQGYTITDKQGISKAYSGAWYGWLDSLITPKEKIQYRYDGYGDLNFIYHYDKSGSLVKTEKIGWDRRYGNITSINDGRLLLTYTVSDLKNNTNIGKSYYRKNQNFYDTETYSGTINRTFKHSYEFDDLGRLAKEIITENGNVFITRSYSY
jgi:YD repeat-containing protein